MCYKHSYISKRKAKKAAYAIKCKGRISPREALYPYYCKSCGAWHLSTKSPEQFFHQLK